MMTVRRNVHCSKVFAFAMCFLLTAVCVSPGTVYSASEQPTDKPARIEAASGISLESVDGKRITSLSIKVPPGQHTVEMSVLKQSGGVTVERSRDNCFLVFNAAEGHTYRVDATPPENGMYQGFIIDKNTNQRVVLGCNPSVAAESNLGNAEMSLKLDPRNPLLWTKKGVALWFLKRYEEGLVALDKATALKEDLTAAWYWKGGCLYRLGRYEEALQAIDKAISLEPSQAQSMQKDRDLVLAAMKKKNEATTEKNTTETALER
jgi:hypothetical protein